MTTTPLFPDALHLVHGEYLPLASAHADMDLDIWSRPADGDLDVWSASPQFEFDLDVAPARIG